MKKNLGEQDIYQTVTVDLSSVVSDTPGDTLDIIDVHSDKFTQVTSTGGLILNVKGELAGGDSVLLYGHGSQWRLCHRRGRGTVC
ncbi:hypothetical protein QW180_17425 [Vibrio sinaloensis]|nr:hypothetical protein [Vibrio sinaloensis]